jgi:hypothetical protein
MDKIILDTFIVDRDAGTIITNIDDALANVEVQKKRLFNNIKNYLALEGSTILEEDINNKSVNELI